jgi:drug/metabolite transporter (DMT)-like permease
MSLTIEIVSVVQVLGKSVKPIPVMILGVVLARKRYSWKKYMFVLMITLGVALFLYKPSENKGKGAADDHVVGWGEILLVSFMILLIFKCVSKSISENSIPVVISVTRWIKFEE